MFTFIKKIRINRIIKILISVMVFANTADGLIAPIFPIFIMQRIEGADLKTIGYAVAIYWISKSILQIPISRYLDKTRGENDDLFSMMLGNFLFAVVALLYIFAKTKFDLFLLQGLLAFAGALFIPPWYAIFTRHVDKFEVSFEWSVNSGLLGVGMASAGALSGILATKYGFDILFVAAFVINIIALGFAALLYRYLVKLSHDGRVYPEALKK